jgi:hypothetical protein
MKITREDAVGTVVIPKSPRDTKTNTGAFDTLLRSAIEDRVSPHRQLGTSGVKASSVTGSPIVDTAAFLSTDKPQIIAGTERILDTLDEYQAKLADTKIPLADLLPIVEKLNCEKDLLLPFIDALPETDPLRDLLNRALITCSIEVGKFERGDYL